MAANVETMFYAGREKPWHGLGTQVDEAPTSADALRLAGLDWTVERKPIQVCGGRKVDNFFANVRSSDGAVLGVVSDRYQVVQNAEAFAFTDALIGGESRVHYVLIRHIQAHPRLLELGLNVAGVPDRPRTLRAVQCDVQSVVANHPDRRHTHADSAAAVMGIGEAQIRLGFIADDLRIGQFCQQPNLTSAHETPRQYMDKLAVYADQMANKTVTDEQIAKILDEMFPATEDMSEREKRNAEKARTEYMICYFAPDILKFKGTAWGALNAMSDMVGHNAPRRQTANYRENNWGRIMDGHAMMDKMASLLAGAGTR